MTRTDANASEPMTRTRDSASEPMTRTRADASAPIRTEQLFDEHRNSVYRRTDRLFAGLMLFQWLAGIALTLWISPQTWIGSEGSIHIHVYLAIFLGGALAVGPAWLAFTRPGSPLTRHTIAVCQALT